MKSLCFVSAVLFFMNALGDEVAERQSTLHVGKPAWNMRCSYDPSYSESFRIKFERADQPAPPPFPLSIDAQSPESISINRDGLKGFVFAGGKFSEWSAVAKQNGVKAFEKPIDITDLRIASHEKYTFRVKNGACSLVIDGGLNKAEITELDLPPLSELIQKIPQIEAGLKQNAKSPSDKLFK